MKKWPLIVITCFCAAFSYAQSYKEQLSKLSLPGDSAEMFNLLSKWEKADPSDPELYVGWINYFFRTAKKTIVRVGTTKEDNSVSIQDSSGKTAGYLSEQLVFDSLSVQKGLDYIERGIALHPRRLDMRFGKIYVLGETGDFALFTNEVVRAIDYGDSIENKWLWKNGEALDDPAEFLLSTVQNYILQLYDIGDEYLGDMRRICEAVLRYHPNDVRFLSDISITYSLQQQQAKALEFLLRAESIDPTDFIILNNIARNYEAIGDTTNAIKYYKLTLKYGDDRAKTDAQKKLKELKR